MRLIGAPALLDDFFSNPRSPLISIKARPYHYKGSAIILGDAAHSMAPFFGQGLNCGLEDVRVLEVLLRKWGAVPGVGKNGLVAEEGVRRAFEEYTETRYEDLVAICDMAMDN